MTEKKTIVRKAKNLKKVLGPFADLGPPPDVPSLDEVHVLDQTFAKLLPGQVVEPEDGYDVHSPHGLLSCGPGPSNRLLCLADAFEWMRGKELPRKAVVNAVLAPLVQLDEADGGYRRQELYVVNGEDYAYPLSLGERLNPKARVVWEALDFAYHDTYSMGVVREIADLWDASWPGYVKDPGQFYQDGWIRYCNVMKRLAQSSLGPEDWEEEYRARYYMSLDEWKERCERAVRFLSLLAVPLSVAHELWGWGRVAAVEAQPEAVTSTPPLQAFEAEDVGDWSSLVRYRLQFVDVAAQARPKWLPSHVGVLAERVRSECESGRGSGALGRLRKEFDISRQALGGLLKKHGYDASTGKKIQAAATPFTGIGSGGKKAA